MGRNIELTVEFPVHIWQIVEKWLEKYGYSKERFVWVLLALFNAHEQTENNGDLIFITDSGGNVKNQMLLPRDNQENRESDQELHRERVEPLSIEESEFFRRLEAQMKISIPKDPAV